MCLFVRGKCGAVVAGIVAAPRNVNELSLRETGAKSFPLFVLAFSNESRSNNGARNNLTRWGTNKEAGRGAVQVTFH